MLHPSKEGLPLYKLSHQDRNNLEQAVAAALPPGSVMKVDVVETYTSDDQPLMSLKKHEGAYILYFYRE